MLLAQGHKVHSFDFAEWFLVKGISSREGRPTVTATREGFAGTYKRFSLSQPPAPLRGHPTASASTFHGVEQNVGMPFGQCARKEKNFARGNRKKHEFKIIKIGKHRGLP